MTSPPLILDRCPCGLPWEHDADTQEGRDLIPFADREVALLGPVVPIVVGQIERRYLVARYYLARHRFAGHQIPGLFPELGQPGCLVFGLLPAICCARCGRTSWNPGDVAKLQCGQCGWNPIAQQG